MSNQAIVLNTPEAIDFFQLCQWRGALKMEARGMYHSRLGKIRKPVALMLGMKPNTKIELVIEEIQKRIDAAQAAREVVKTEARKVYLAA